MKLIDAYRPQLEKISANPTLAKFLSGINVIKVEDIDDLSSIAFNRNDTIVVGKSLTTRDVIEIANFTGLRHVLSEDREDFVFSLISACLLLKKPSLFLEKPLSMFDIHLGVSSEEKSEPHQRTFTVKRLRDKSMAIAVVRDELEKVKETRLFVDEAQVVIDELLINAFYHGPRLLQKTVPGSNQVLVNRERDVKVFLIYNKERLFVGCIDSYGSLSNRNLAHHLHNQVNQDIIEVDRHRKTGGLGLTYLIENSAGIYTVVNSMRQTLVATMFPLGKGKAFLGSYPRNLHFCEY